jgi:hypothetical protein
MNCQPPKIISSSENFPGKSGERLVMCGVPPGKWVKKYKNFGGLKLNNAKIINNSAWERDGGIYCYSVSNTLNNSSSVTIH